MSRTCHGPRGISLDIPGARGMKSHSSTTTWPPASHEPGAVQLGLLTPGATSRDGRCATTRNDPSAIKLCAEAFRSVWELAVPHTDYSI